MDMKRVKWKGLSVIKTDLSSSPPHPDPCQKSSTFVPLTPLLKIPKMGVPF